MSDDTIDFWFTMGSTYTFLAVSRLAKVVEAEKVRVRWRPFHLRVLLDEMNSQPFVGKPARTAHMWRDIARRAAMYGLTASLPAPYPVPSEIANRVAIVGMREGWGEAYVRAAYRYWFERGEGNGSEANLDGSLREVGQDPARVLPLARSDEVGAAMMADVDAARALGIFGSPTFVVGTELFWGDDRLEDAISWQRHGRVVAR